MATSLPQAAQRPPAGTAAPPGYPTRLAAVRRGLMLDHLRYVFFGVEGVGKSTLAAFSPDPIWFDLEDGTKHLPIARYVFRDEPGGHVPRLYAEVCGAIRDLRLNDHAFKTLVIDTADRLQSLVWQFVIDRDSGVKSNLNKSGRKLLGIEDYGYAKGYQVALDEWRALARHLDDLRAHRGMNIILLAHAQIRTFKNPEGEDYDRYHLRVHDQAAGFLKEWADVVGFCCFEEFGGKLDPDAARAKGTSTGRRLIKLERTAAYDAKSRIPLPAQVELSADDPWAPLAAAVRAASDMTPAAIRACIAAECDRIGDPDLTDKVRSAATATEDAMTLMRYLNDLRRRDARPTTETSNG